LGRVFGSPSQAATQTAKRRFRLRTLIILALLLFQALCVQPHRRASCNAVIPSWDDPDTRWRCITPLSAAEMDQGLRTHHPSPARAPRGAAGLPTSGIVTTNPAFSDVIAPWSTRRSGSTRLNLISIRIAMLGAHPYSVHHRPRYQPSSEADSLAKFYGARTLKHLKNELASATVAFETACQ